MDAWVQVFMIAYWFLLFILHPKQLSSGKYNITEEARDTHTSTGNSNSKYLILANKS